MESLKDRFTEEEARGLMGLLLVRVEELEKSTQKTKGEILGEIIDRTLNLWKEKGYIKENPVEKAKRILDIDMYGSIHVDQIQELFCDFRKAIEYLENKVKELESGNEVFHGGCLTCETQKRHGILRCEGCCFFDQDWNMPDLRKQK